MSTRRAPTTEGSSRAAERAHKRARIAETSTAALNLSCAPLVGDAALAHAAGKLRAAPLTAVNFFCARLGVTAVRRLSPHFAKHALVEISLARNRGMGAEGVAALAPHIPSTVRRLNLCNTGMGDDGVRALAPHLPGRLRELLLATNRFGNEGLCAVLRSAMDNGWVRTVRVLDVRFNHITSHALLRDVTTEALSNVVELEELRLDGQTPATFAHEPYSLRTIVWLLAFGRVALGRAPRPNVLDVVDVEVNAYARATTRWTELHLHADNRDAELVRRLLDEEGADPRLVSRRAARVHPHMGTALALASSTAYPAASSTSDAALRAMLADAVERVRWSPATHWQCPKEVRTTARARATMMAGRGIGAVRFLRREKSDGWRFVPPELWGLIFGFLIDGAHARRALRTDGRERGWCCRHTSVVCAACRARVYADAEE